MCVCWLNSSTTTTVVFSPFEEDFISVFNDVHVQDIEPRQQQRNVKQTEKKTNKHFFAIESNSFFLRFLLSISSSHKVLTLSLSFSWPVTALLGNYFTAFVLFRLHINIQTSYVCVLCLPCPFYLIWLNVFHLDFAFQFHGNMIVWRRQRPRHYWQQSFSEQLDLWVYQRDVAYAFSVQYVYTCVCSFACAVPCRVLCRRTYDLSNS